MSDIDKYFAEQCNIEVFVWGDNCYTYWALNDKTSREIFINDLNKAVTLDIAEMLRAYGMEWSIKDPRCMVIIEEVFCISTEWVMFPFGDSYWQASCDKGGNGNACSSSGKTPHLARIACITALYEVSKND